MLTVYQAASPSMFTRVACFHGDFGVCLFCPGGDGSMIRIERCSFTGNQAIGTQDNYGAAVAFSFLTILREKESLPRHEVVDW